MAQDPPSAASDKKYFDYAQTTMNRIIPESVNHVITSLMERPQNTMAPVETQSTGKRRRHPRRAANTGSVTKRGKGMKPPTPLPVPCAVPYHYHPLSLYNRCSSKGWMVRLPKWVEGRPAIADTRFATREVRTIYCVER